MCKFRRLDLNTLSGSSLDLHYIPLVKNCWDKYSKYIQDDFSLVKNSGSFLNLLKSVMFWVVLDYEENFMGFVFLDNFVGNDDRLYSAEITTCFDKKAWGSFTRYSAKFFLKMCFDEFGLYKVKGQIYPDNFRVKTFLKDCGFTYETTLIKETLRDRKPQNIEVYALYRSYYYKD